MISGRYFAGAGAGTSEDALRLPDTERADLAARLIESLDPLSDADALPSWAAEIERRIADLDSGAVRPVPWSEARRMIAGEREPDAASGS